MKTDYYPDFLSNHFYHIYNRANGKGKLFFQERNYNYFLKRYSDYLGDYLDTYAYNLLQNHFHLVVRIKSEEAILAANRKSIPLQDGGANSIVNPLVRNRISEQSVSNTVVEQFRKLFISYSKAINVQENRTGSLFQKKFKRKLINHPKYLRNMIY